MMKIIIVGIIAFCLGLMVAAGADAQWRSFKTTDGLVDNTVNCMLEDRI